MITRSAQSVLKELRTGYPVITITGPRQSGKTTLARMAFPEFKYSSLENPDTLMLAREDPRAFLNAHRNGGILDEVQRLPELPSYLQQIIDEGPSHCRFILTGSQQFGLLSRITQSLAGRSAYLHLLPFSLSELYSGEPPALMECIFPGFYPPVHDRSLDPVKWYAGYMQSYIERDVRQLVNVHDLNAFQTFIRMCAARNGQLLNLSSLANDCGITHNTARSWISILEASYIVFLLRPYHRNMGKRLVKTPKLYFYDTGLLAYLLGIRSTEELSIHAHRGSIFEALVISEVVKTGFNTGIPPTLYFWRDHKGVEIDLLIETRGKLRPVEIKSGQTIAGDWFKNLSFWKEIYREVCHNPAVVYGGSDSVQHTGSTVIPWTASAALLQ